MNNWTRHGLPDRLDRLTFLDVGCYEGEMCLEAHARGAAQVLGVDYCTCPELSTNLAKGGFEFIQIDILSEKAIQLPAFDLVYCAGVLYHTESPLNLLFRLRKLTKRALWIETTVYDSPEPVMFYHQGDSFDANPSNWWTPSEPCLREMMTQAGFSDLAVTVTVPASPFGRIVMTGQSAEQSSSPKLLPRRPAYMPHMATGGSRQ